MIDPALSVSPRTLSCIAFASFAAVTVSFAIAPGALWAEYLGLLFHLSLFLLVAKLPVPSWAAAAGYGWLVLDVTTGVSIISGVPGAVAEYFRLSGHIFGGVWIAVASLQGAGVTKVIGCIAGIWLTSYTFASATLPPLFLAPASVLVLAWLLLVAWNNGTSRIERLDVFP